MKKKLLSFVLCAVFILGLIPARSLAATKIYSVGIADLSYPRSGIAPDTEITLTGSGYSVYSVDWYDATANYYLSPGEVATANHVYQVVIWLEANNGYEFHSLNDNSPNISATVNGISASVTKAYEYKAWAMVDVRFTFPATPQRTWVDSVDLWPTAPAVGKDLTYDLYSRNNFKLITLSGTESYTKYGESWMCNGEYMSTTGNKFAADNIYTYCATVTPAYGYSFSLDPIVTVGGNPALYTTEYVDGVGEVMHVKYNYPKLQAPPHEHSSTQWIAGSTDYHYKVCSTCGESFAYEDHVGGTATCNEQAQCTVCGQSYGGLAEHTPSAWRTVEPYHYKVCTLCGEFLTSEDHVGGTATCTQKAKCTVCGQSYGQLGLTHRWGSTWLYKDKTGHASVCLDCGANGQVVAHTPGADATETTPQVCTDCGYIIAPVKKHVHQLTKTAAKTPTCSDAGNKEYYSCSGCSDLFTDAAGKNLISETDISIPAKGHKASGYEYNDEFHWKTCTDCGIVLAQTKLPHEDADKNGKCDSCNKVLQAQTAATTLPTTETSTAQTQASEPPEESTPPMTTVLPEASENTTPPETTATATEPHFGPVGTVVTSSPVATEAQSSENQDGPNNETQTSDDSNKGNSGAQGNQGNKNSIFGGSRLEKKTLIALAIAVPSSVLVLGGGALILILVLKKKK